MWKKILPPTKTNDSLTVDAGRKDTLTCMALTLLLVVVAVPHGLRIGLTRIVC